MTSDISEELKTSLDKIKSCEEPYVWARENNIASQVEAWNKCEDWNWLMFLLTRSNYDVYRIEDAIKHAVEMPLLGEEKYKQFYDLIFCNICKEIKNNKIDNFVALKQLVNNKIFNFGNVDKNITQAVSCYLKIMVYNNAEKKPMLSFAEPVDIYFSPFLYLEKHGISKSDLAKLIKDIISAEEIIKHLNEP